jgi:hypothetical protein
MGKTEILLKMLKFHQLLNSNLIHLKNINIACTGTHIKFKKILLCDIFE